MGQGGPRRIGYNSGHCLDGDTHTHTHTHTYIHTYIQGMEERDNRRLSERKGKGHEKYRKGRLKKGVKY